MAPLSKAQGYYQLTISTVENGYAVKPASAHETALYKTYVFQSFDALTEWLEKNLAMPTEGEQK